MLITCCYFCYFIRYSCDVVRRIFIAKCTKTKLSLFVTTTHKESANIINKTCMESSGWYRFDVRFIILVKVYWTRRILSCNFLTNCCATLTIFILAPGEYITNFCSHDRVKSATRNLNWLIVKKSINKYRTKLLFQVRFINSKLSLRIVSHSVTKLWS